jgi:hypothetical protein
MLTEASGEVWKFQSTGIFNKITNEWQRVMIPFTDFFQKINYVNGYLNTDSIVTIELRLLAPANIKITGSLLFDNFSGYIIEKTDTWIPINVDEQILDENGILISGTSSRWDSLSQEFIPYFKYKNDIIYNENGQILQSQLTFWNEYNENWINETKQLNEYDEYGNLTKSESYYWDASISNWVGTWKSETNWDEFGNTILSVNYQWNFESQNWLPNYKAENKYDASGRQLMYSSYNWNNELKRWIGNYKNETILNDNLEKIRTINYEWNFSENDWKVSYSYVHTESNEMYNEEGLLISISYTAWDENLKVWSPTEKYYIYYSSHSISTKIEAFTNFENEMLEVYPNPASELINILFRNEVYFGKYSLFNTLGQLQKSDIITDKITALQVDNLPQGIYYLIIDTNNTKISKKIIIR